MTNKTSMSFHDMNLPQNLKASLDSLNFTTPTPIQSQTIPLALEGRDVLGSAQTGTGKTLAFALPLIAKICENPTAGGLILTPTRELAQQIVAAIRAISAKNLQIKTTLVIGGDPIFKQVQNLRNAPQIIVGTPGRVIDHLERGTLKTDVLNFLILDEADRMFDMGFGIQLDRIMSELPKERQTLMFSATLPPSIEKLASKHLTNPARVSIGSVVTPIQNIKQDMVRVSEGDKYSKLLDELNEREGSVIIFVKTKMGTERLAEKLSRDDHESIAIHGDLRQQKRERVINSFRKGATRIMVATDVVARGLDIPHIQHVINYDLPQCPEDYIHRIGRTARAGAQGSSLCLISAQDAKKWFAIQRFMDPSAKEDRSYSSGGGSKSNAGRGFSGAGRKSDPYAKPHRKSQSESSGARFGDKEGGTVPPRKGESFWDQNPSASRASSSPRPNRGEGFGDRARPSRSEGERSSRRPDADGNRFSGPRSDRFADRAPNGERTSTDRPSRGGERSSGPRFDRFADKAPNGERVSSDRPSRGGERSSGPRNGFGDKPAPRNGSGKPSFGGGKKTFSKPGAKKRDF